MLLLGGMLAGVAAPASASHGRVAIVDYGQFNNSPKGLLVCVASGSFDYCFVVQENIDDPSNPLTELVVQEFHYPDQIPDRTITAAVPPDAIQFTTASRPTMTFNAEVPHLGQVSLTLTDLDGFSSRADATDSCVGDAIHAEVVSIDSGIHTLGHAAGSIAGVPAYGNRVCDFFFTSATNGIWRMAAGG